MDVDVAVIGAGVSGAYSAWRLQQHLGPGARVALFEYGDRIGGRLYTVTLPGMPHVKAEVGGMRYIPDAHPMVTGLVDHLGLPTADFPMGAPPPVGSRCNLFYLRGRHLRLHELDDPGKVPYDLAWSERGLGPTNLQVQAMNAIRPGMADLGLCDLMRLTAFGKPLWKYGFWNLMYKSLSNEGYQFMKDAGGYDANVANANAVTQLPATEYSDSTQFLTLRDGYDQLPITLVRQFQEMPGGVPAEQRVAMNHRLTHLLPASAAGGPYQLVFERTTTDSGRTTALADAEPVTVGARQVVLAMPRRSLELVESPVLDDPWVRENLGSVLIQSAFKLFLAYETPWWRSLGLVAGRSVTDLPIRQTYYFGTESEKPDGLPFLNSLLMASYNDISTVPFWKGLEDGAPYPGYLPACVEPGVTDPMPAMEFPATDEMVRVANEQVAAVHALPQVPLPYSAVYHSWNEDPYGGGWHEWKAGYRLDEIMCRMRRPVPSQDVYVVGEAYSYQQGWVEGALDTAESMLEEFFGLPRPAWLDAVDPDYDLLPVTCPGCASLSGCVECQDAAEVLDGATPDCLGPTREG